MEFRVLGPLEVVDERGRPIAMGGPQRRAVLCMLLARHPRDIRTDELIAALWGEDPPPSAPKLLQGIVFRIRRSLGCGGTDDLLLTTTDGYRVDLGAHSCDRALFERELAEAKRPAPDPHEQLRHLESALSRWRGRPFEDAAELSGIDAEVARLDELRLDAIERHAEALIALGREHEAAAELEGHIVEHPFRERLWALRVRALYQGGRQADALATFRRAASLLAEELGVEPGPELNDLERAILSHDPSLAKAQAADGASIHLRACPAPGARDEDIDAFQDVVDGAIRGLSGQPVAGHDGIAATFPDVDTAISCASAVSDGLDERRGALPRWVLASIGIAEGSSESSRIAAARLSEGALPGSIVCSEEIQQRRTLRLRPKRSQTGAPALPPELETARLTPIVGRRTDLDRALASLEHPRPALVITGEPGIGKTRLLAEVAAVARDAGDVVLHGRCVDGAHIPFQPVASALRGWVEDRSAGELLEAMLASDGALGRLVSELSFMTPDEPIDAWGDASDGRRRLFDGLASWLSSLQPVVLAIDDLQWAEPSTLRILLHLIRAPQLDRLTLVTSGRDTEIEEGHPVAGFLRDLRAEDDIVDVHLTGLPPDVVPTLAAAIGAITDAQRYSELHEATGGNPFMLTRLLGIPDGTVPTRLLDVIDRRVSMLSEHARRLLCIAAVAGREFDLVVCGDASGLDVAESIDAAEEAIRANLLEDATSDPDRLRFVHDLVRQTVLDGLTIQRRRAIHLAIAEALESRFEPPPPSIVVELALHWASAGKRGDAERAARYAAEAATDALQRQALEDAEEAAIKGIEALREAASTDDHLRTELLLLRARSRLRHGDNQRSIELIREAAMAALQTDDPIHLAWATVCTGQWAFDAALGLELADRAIRVLDSGDHEHLRHISRVKTARVIFLQMLLRREADAAHEEIVPLARSTGDVDALNLALSVASNDHMTSQHPQLARSMSDELLALAQARSDRTSVAAVHHKRCVYHLISGDIPAFDRALRELTAIASDPLVSQASIAAFVSLLPNTRSIALGHFPETRVASDLSGLMALAASYQQLWLGWERGELTAVRETAASVAAGLGAELVRLMFEGLEMAATAAMGDLDLATRWLATTGARLEAGPRHAMSSALDRAWLTEVTASTGDPTLVDGLETYFEDMDGALVVGLWGLIVWGSRHRALGMLAGLRGDVDAAEAAFAHAVEVEEDMGAITAATRTKLWWAKVLRRCSPERARSLAEDAEHAADSLGMAWVAHESGRVLRTLRSDE